MHAANPFPASPLPDADAPLFDALLVPHRSLGRTGFYVLMGSLAVIWGFSSLLFLAKGAWPVFGFFGLDMLAIWLAFRINYRAAQAREEVRISRAALAIRQVSPSGKASEHVFNPLWARFHVARHPEIGVTSMVVAGQGRRVALGSFLNPDDRDSFASAFARALSEARR